MIKKSKIYTKTGDKGETVLVSGKRISKADTRIDLYGEVDELNSRIGFACSYLKPDFSQLEFLHRIQSSLFDLGSNLACEPENRSKFTLPQLNEELIKDIESKIDEMDSELEPLKNFILPGGTHAASAFHLARTSARNVERKLIHFGQLTKEGLPELSVIFLNRLSDYFFVLSRYINLKENRAEIVWKP